MRILTDVLTKVAGSRALALQTKSPTIFFVAGIAGVVTSTVLACRATLQLEDVLSEFEEDVVQDEVDPRVRLRAGVAVAKLYAPAAIIGFTSIVMLSKSHSTLTKRNAGLAAAYTALDEGFAKYRSRVVEKYGQEADDEMRYGAITEKAKTLDGKKVPAVTRVNPETGASIYAKFFDEYNYNFNRDPELNKLFLRAQQNYLTDRLHSRGHLFLNEAYDALGFEHTRAGAVVGWIMGAGDNYVDLGIFNSHAPDGVRDFVNGHEAAVLLDFNVDGVIFDRIKEDPTDGSSKGRWLRL